MSNQFCDLEWVYDLGAKVFPLQKDSKVPLESGSWRASDYDMKRAKEYRDEGYNLAVAIPRGKVVLDVDTRNGGLESLKRLNDDLKLKEPLQKESPTVVTPTGGYHIWLDIDPELKLRGKMGTDRYPGIDIRKHGNYVVAPGSKIGSEKYEWIPNSIEDGKVKKDCVAAPEKLQILIRKKVLDENSVHQPPGELDANDVKAILDRIDVRQFNHCRAEWIQLALACHYASNGCPLAREEFIEWSAGDADYDSEAMRDNHRMQWSQFTTDGGITTGTLFEIAKQYVPDYSELKSELFGGIISTVDDFEMYYETDEDGNEIEKLPFGVVSFEVLDKMDLKVEYLINGILVENQPMVIGGVSKTLKSSIGLDMVVSLATGHKFLGEYAVNRRAKTLFLTAETDMATTRAKARIIAEQKSKGCKGCQDGNECYLPDGVKCKHEPLPDDYMKYMYIGPRVPRFSRPGKNADDRQLQDLINLCMLKEIEVLVIDPAYLALPSEDSNNIFAQGELFRSLNEVMEQMGVTLILLHHNTKSSSKISKAPPSMFDLSGAGYSEFARQWLLLARREDYKADGIHRLWFVGGGSAGHSLQRTIVINEGVLPAQMNPFDDADWRRWEPCFRGDPFKDLKDEDVATDANLETETKGE